MVMTGGRDPVDREAAFVALFDAYYGKILAYARRRVDFDVASDVVADTFVAAWLRLDDLSGDPLGWLYGLARGSVANHRRRLHRAERLRERASTNVPCSPTTGDPAEEVAWRASFTAAFGQLSESDREVLRLVAWEGLDPAAAAKVLGCSRGTFKVRLHRARRRLRRYLMADVGTSRRIMATNRVLTSTAPTEPRDSSLVVPKEFPCL